VFASAADRITDLRPTVILISLDGFRPDYLGSNTPSLNSLAERGVRARWMIPSFPTKTFPNHYTIATGLFPAHHGIIGNSFQDPNFKAKFSMSDRDAVKDARWWGGEPIWVTAEKQGVRTAPVFWPGSEAAIEGIRPTYYEAFDDKRTAEERVDKLLSLLDLPGAKRPQLLTLYMSNVDHAGHEYGPGTPQVDEAVAKVDAAVGKLLAGLRERGIEDQVNIIVVSDHGMAPTSRKRVDILDDYVDLKTIQVIDYGPVVSLRALDGNNQALFARLRHIPHVHAYLSNDVPARWHYSGSPRIMPILLVCDAGWLLQSREFVQKHADFQHGGNHGYDNRDKSMRATFIAAGPGLAKHAVLPPFPNVDVYSLLAYLLNVSPAETDGTLDVFKPVLVKRDDPHRTERAPWRKELDQDARLGAVGDLGRPVWQAMFPDKPLTQLGHQSGDGQFAEKAHSYSGGGR
jgi:predicted AlkP superfamily pyrophosphatase or phosphodiesterase